MSVPRWIRAGVGPVIVGGLVLAGVLGARYFPEKRARGPEAIEACRTRADTVREIQDEAILRDAPRPDRFGDVKDAGALCTTTAAVAAVIRPLAGSVPEDEVRAFYAKLAESNGWHQVDRGEGVYSATKDADGGCPWWFVMTPQPYGFELKVSYLPTGVSENLCAWK